MLSRAIGTPSDSRKASARPRRPGFEPLGRLEDLHGIRRDRDERQVQAASTICSSDDNAMKFHHAIPEE